MSALTLSLLPDAYAVCRLDPAAAIPAWATAGALFCAMRTPDELSLMCAEAYLPQGGVQAEKGWRAFKLEGPFDFGLTGILASALNPLAEAGIGIFALSTYDTDYVLVKEAQREQAIRALRQAGHTVR